MLCFWYTVHINTTYPQQTNKKCPICQSPIEIISKVTEVEEGQKHPVTTTKYACTNKQCRARSEKEMADKKQQRMNLIEQKEKHIREIREKKAQEMKKV